MCCLPPECNDAWTDERRWRQEVLRLLSCFLTTNVARDTEILVLCDVREVETIPFIRIVTVNCDGTRTVEDFELDATTPFTVEGEVSLCSLAGVNEMFCIPPISELPLDPSINCIINLIGYTGPGTMGDGLYYWNGNTWVPWGLD